MERERATRFIHELLELLVKEKGSDLFITAGFPPATFVNSRCLIVPTFPCSAQKSTPFTSPCENHNER